MDNRTVQQIRQIIQNYVDKHKVIPFFQNLEQDPVFWPLFQQFSSVEKDQIQGIINEYIDEKIQWLNTKGGELFRRFYDVRHDLFWQFRKMNADPAFAGTVEFHTLGKQVEAEMFKYEGILTEKMLKRAEGLDKTLDSFYGIVYMFFPLYGQIE